MTTITIGQGRLNSLGERLELDGATVTDFFEADAELSADALEPWISGHVWRGDRRLSANWESAGVIFVDADYYGGDAATHDFTTEEAREKLESVVLVCSGWHHTPRGFRAWFDMRSQIIDPAVYLKTLEAAARSVNDALEAVEVLGKRGLKQGYRSDAATTDLARWMYRPNCVVEGRARRAEIRRGTQDFWTVEEITHLGAGTTALAREVISRMPHAGPGDGSLELLRTCRRALSLGVSDFETFQKVVKDWNQGRWSEDDLRRRWTDAERKWLSEGRVVVPTNDKGKPVYGLDVLELVLDGDRKYRGRFRRNLLDQTVLLGMAPMIDEDITEIRLDVRKRYGLTVPKDDAHDCSRAIAMRNAFSPVSDWLNGLRWDGVDRVPTIARDVLGLAGDEAELGEIYLRRWGVAAVHRARRQGVKVDTVLLLVGAQGAGKSSFFRVLAGSWFSDTYLDLSSKDGLIQLLGTWIYELSELEAVYRRADVARVRAVISSVEDRYRAPYERSVRSHPRRVVFVGTSNSFDVLQDPDGSRRFWGLEIQKVDLIGLAGLREGYWAQCVADADAGVAHWLTPEEDALRRRSNARFERDMPEIDRAVVAIEKMAKAELTMGDILARLGYPTGGAPVQLQGAVSTALGRSGYRRLGARWVRAS